jgi:L-alanine-DL-glutamate epimerase-like enolase superfamily enzyme
MEEKRMKITKIELIPVSLSRPAPSTRQNNVVLIKMHTDEGIVGVADGGEYPGGGGQELVMSIIKTWEPMLIGADPFDKEKILARLERFIHTNVGLSYPGCVALIDFALWDIVGKAHNQPIYQLLGGKRAEKLQVDYVISDVGNPSAKEVAAVAAKAVENGCMTFCLKVGGSWGSSFSKDIENVKETRAAIGDNEDIHFCIDANGSLDYTTALEYCRRLEKYNLYKFEQPLVWWDIAGMARLRSSQSIPICAHESSVKVPFLVECIRQDACDMVGTKVVWAGGISEAVKWGYIAKAANLGVYCGSMNGPFEAAAQAQWLASDEWYGRLAHANLFPMFYHGTFDTTGSLEREDIVVKPLGYKNGYCYPPDGPGIGLELNETAVPKFITKGLAPVTIGG